jgi:tetraacyldisaccharide 4'-kinase
VPRIAQILERGVAGPRPWHRGVSRPWLWTFGRSVARRLEWPPHVRVVAVGGATLGGSGKTPLAIACAMELSAVARTILVGHGYRGAVRRTRFVLPSDALGAVGDEAIVAARDLEASGLGARVVVGPTRSAAMAWAAGKADILVLDGVCQTAPTRASLALLAVDAAKPWGNAAALPPFGDLRAPVSMLLEACDAIVPIGDRAGPSLGFAQPGRTMPIWPASVESRGAWLHAGRSSTAPRSEQLLLSWETLRPLRVGLVTAMARPDRVVRDLALRGVRPCAVVCAADHGPVGAGAVRACFKRAQAERVEVWLSTPKCALHVDGARLGAPVAVLEYGLGLPPTLAALLRAIALP